jgi:hypothetical protein
MEYPADPMDCHACRWRAPRPGRAGGRLLLCAYHRERELDALPRTPDFICTPLADFLPRGERDDRDPRERAVMDAPVSPPRPAHPSRAKPSRGTRPQGLDIGE